VLGTQANSQFAEKQNKVAPELTVRFKSGNQEVVYKVSKTDRTLLKENQVRMSPSLFGYTFLHFKPFIIIQGLPAVLYRLFRTKCPCKSPGHLVH
jgi:hypothetical protein